MGIKRWILTLAWLSCGAISQGQPGRIGPRVGYLSPAGACRNTTAEILAGGQNLRSMTEVRVSGTGVRARIIKTYRMPRNLDGDQRELLKWRVSCRRAELNGEPLPPQPKPKPGPDGKSPTVQPLPDTPLLDMLRALDLQGLRHWQTVFQRRDRMQPSPQLGELVRMEIHVSPDAEPGIRELRLWGPLGLTNPIRFEVGTLPEVFETEPNEPGEGAFGPVAELPITFNGQIQAGDVDVMRFHARRGQNLVVRGEARSLIPYLADAVPGWFQMVAVVRDARGREVAYGDDFRFDPDPVFFFKVPEDGDYQLEVRDSIHRGREDFIYRISVGELPFVTSVFPLGGRQGEPLDVAARGWNLTAEGVRLDTSPGGAALRVVRSPASFNGVSYAVDSLAEYDEVEPADDAAVVPFPCVINGRIDKAGDADVFRVEGRKGQELIVEVLARRLRSPLDSVVHVADERGRVLGWNDDSMEKDGHLHLGDGLLTHHADSRLRVEFPADGPVFVRIADTQLRGGAEFGYRLRLGEARPDFELRVTPSVLNVVPGGHVPLEVHVMRSEGFEGEIKLVLKDAPSGFRLSGARIPASASKATITLSALPKVESGVFTPVLTGFAVGQEQSVARVALAADDMMQAFLWRHLVPASEWLVCVTSGRSQPAIDLVDRKPARVPVGGSAEVVVKMPRWIMDRGVDLEPNDAPAGIRLSPARRTADGMAFDIMADSAAAPGTETNLIVTLISRAQPARKGNKAKQPIQLGGLPAIPITVVSPNSP